jgi:hypothetical protein
MYRLYGRSMARSDGRDLRQEISQPKLAVIPSALEVD